MAERPDWDTYFLNIANQIKLRGTCPRFQTGTVVTRDNSILATGYNGAPPGLPHCSDVGHKMEHGHCVRTIHGELNAILNAAKQGVTLKNSTFYVIGTPCYRCALHIVSVGAERVVTFGTYDNVNAKEVLNVFAEAGVQYDVVEED